MSTASSSAVEQSVPGDALRPAEVAEQLGISAATLRRWSSRFGDYLNATRDGTQETGSHRRYTEQDVETLGRIKTMLEQGWTYEQVAQALSDGSGPAGADEGQAKAEGASDGSYEPPERGEDVFERGLVRSSAAQRDQDERLPAEPLSPGAQFLSNALQAVADTQQIILNSQHANRDMLGVMIQDNLNLKNENTGLRERMLELERELAELRRRQADQRERFETRVRVLEDAVATLMANQQQVLQRSAQQAPPPYQPQSPTQPQPERRSFWARLIGG